MVLDDFINEVNSIQNPTDRKVFLSILIDKKMSNIEKAYQESTYKYLRDLHVEVKSKDLKSLAKMYKELARTESRLLMILDSLCEDGMP